MVKKRVGRVDSSHPSLFLLISKRLMILQMKQNTGKNEIGIIFSSKENDKSEFINHLAQTCGVDTSIYAIHNPNGASLSSVYHQMLTNGNVKEDIVVTVHDDIEFLKNDWGKELKRLFEENKEYGIIGVAGSAQFDDMGAWWRYSKIYGQVLHRHDGKSWLTTFSPLLDHDLEEVAVIDGLFMAFMPSRIKYIYEPTLNGFDFYDIDFCLNNFVHKSCKIGVTTNIRMAHNSIGELKESWDVNRKIINKKYKKYYPIDMVKDGKKETR